MTHTALPLGSKFKRLIAFFADAIALKLMHMALILVSVVANLPASALTIASVLLVASYFPLFESSRLRATPGKLLLGLRVTDMQGGRAPLRRTLLRFALCNTHFLLAAALLRSIPVTDNTPFLHKLISCYGAQLITGLYFFSMLPIFFPERRGLHEKWSGTVTIAPKATTQRDQSEQSVQLGSRFKRWVAQYVDSLIFGFLVTIFSILPCLMYIGEFGLSSVANIGVHGAMLFALLFSYWACFESSKYKATPGKLMLGLEVVGAQFQRISFPRALLRTAIFHVSSILCVCIEGIAHLSSHDELVKSITSLIFTLPVMLIFFFPILFKKRKGLHEWLSGTTVIKRLPPANAGTSP